MKRETIILILIMLTLVLTGMLMIYSIGALRDPGATLFVKHMVYLVAGLLAFIALMRRDYHRLGEKQMLRLIVLGALFLLLLTFVPFFRLTMGGAHRWVRVGFLSFQPSEFAKFALVLLLAVRLTQHQEKMRHFGYGFLMPFFLAGLFVSIVLLQKDIGIPFVMLGATFVMVWVAGGRKLYLLGSSGLCLAGGAFLIWTHPYRMDRIWALSDPWKYRSTIGYQLVQSLSAFSQGEMWGRGPGAGEQKLGYLPAAHTDFVFAVLGEELGFVGAAITVLLFVGMLYVALRICMNAPDLFGSLLATGITMLLTVQAAFIMAVTVGLAPTKGLPLPFVSYGGSALMVSLAMMGVLINIGIQAEAAYPEPEGRPGPRTRRQGRGIGRQRVPSPARIRL